MIRQQIAMGLAGLALVATPFAVSAAAPSKAPATATAPAAKAPAAKHNTCRDAKGHWIKHCSAAKTSKATKNVKSTKSAKSDKTSS